jgi:hypothetical protein
MVCLETSRKWLAAVLMTLSLFTMLHPRPALAHEILPAIADFSVKGDELELILSLDVEALMAGMDLSSPASEAGAAETAAYESLRALPAAATVAAFAKFWPEMATRITVSADGIALQPALRALTPPEDAKPGLARMFRLTLTFDLPSDAEAVSIGWDAAFGPLVLRQNGVSKPYDGYIEPGAVSPPIPLAGGGASGSWATFLDYIPIGFDHILPKGLDHILFILGLFLFNARLRPLLLQVSAFTLAHTVTLAAAAAGVVSIPSAIVEPAIAASIIYIAAENVLAKGISSLRLPVVFLFGLLHGLGFASVLQEFGLPDESFVAALLGFNLGVEFGQLAIVVLAFLTVGIWFNRHRLYRSLVVIPGSTLIGLIGAIWLVERVA